ncbi:MAG TPA: GMC family oxidoreductase [Longimicrobiales bacterium]|nr:GMC family oxidoreductase [Longimicrobiales bacterium]
MNQTRVDVLVVGSGAGGGTVAARLAPLAREGRRILVLEQGPRLEDREFDGSETSMPAALYEDGAGFLTADGTMTLAFGRAYGGSTVVYTGTSLDPPRRVIEGWGVPGLTHEDLLRRTARYKEENGVHFLPPEEINQNNDLFVDGCRAAGYTPGQFPVNLRGCRGSSLCNMGCPNGAKQGTNRVQLPAAEAAGVEVVTRATVRRLRELPDGGAEAEIEVTAPAAGAKGLPSTWTPGPWRVRAERVVAAGGAVGSSALLLRSGLGAVVPRLGHGFTCHPAFILVGEHAAPITNDVGHPKSFYLESEAEGWVLETCMYPPLVTAKNLTGLGPEAASFVEAFPRLQMILVLACDEAVEGNRIEVDREGRPVVRYGFTPVVRERMAAATRAATRIFFGAGAVRVHAPLADPPVLTADEAPMDLDVRIHPRHFLPGRTSVSAAHLMGGCGMGTDATDSVTDSRGRVHGVPWLRVADSALFADSVEINPYLTVMALADRVAEGILDELA